MPECKGKRKHPNQMAAIAAAIRLSNNGKPLRTYRCTTCKKWHLTSKVSLAKDGDGA